MTQRYRIPVSSLLNKRIAATNALSSASGIVGVGIVGIMIVGNTSSASDKDARAVNVFQNTVTDPGTGQKKLYLVKRPGSSVSLTPRAGSIGNAIIVPSGGALADKIITAFGATNSSIYDSTTRLVTNNADTTVITGRATGITETEISTTATLAISSSDSTAWWYQATGTVTKISDTDFPGNAGKTLAGTFAHLDGFACIMTSDGLLYASDINSIANWTANSYGSTNAYPDGGIGCIRFKQNILAFGRYSVEFWRNAGNSPFPLVRSQDATLQVGAVAATAITQISDTIAWCGITPQGGMTIFKFDGSLSRISTPEVDAILSLSGPSNISLSSLRFGGRSFVILLLSGNISYAYCIEENSWHQWNTASYPLWFKTAATTTGSTIVTYMISNTSTGGHVYSIAAGNLVYTDAGDAYTATLQWPLLDFGNNKRKFWSELEIIGDRESAASTITIAKSDDDYQTTDTVATGDMSAARVRATRCGSSRRRAWILSHSAATPLRIEAIEGTVDVGTG